MTCGDRCAQMEHGVPGPADTDVRDIAARFLVLPCGLELRVGHPPQINAPAGPGTRPAAWVFPSERDAVTRQVEVQCPESLRHERAVARQTRLPICGSLAEATIIDMPRCTPEGGAGHANNRD